METKQILNSNPDKVTTMIDEYFNPKNISENAHLEDIVEVEMRAKGLDPLNKNDVRAFWASKGVSING